MAFVRQNGRNPNTLKTRIIEKCILEQDPKIKIEPEDFSDEVDSTILVRERVRGTKLEGAFKKMRGKVLKQSDHTITLMPKGSKGTKNTHREMWQTAGKCQVPAKRQYKTKKQANQQRTKDPKRKEV